MSNERPCVSDTSSSRAWRFYLDDMIGFCERVMVFTAGLNDQAFFGDVMRFDATVRNLELVGEAATRIPDHVRRASPDIPWRMIIATRNQLIHGYLGIDNDTLWSIVSTDIPALLASLNALKLKHPHDHP
jgi:uncharacterized protein with HEPN domain